jgi:hypothetical protein
MRRLWPASKRHVEGVELAGLEPATSWLVRSVGGGRQGEGYPGATAVQTLRQRTVLPPIFSRCPVGHCEGDANAQQSHHGKQDGIRVRT